MKILAILTALTLAAAPVHRDWSASPAIAQSNAKENIFVMGDVHGDYHRLVRALTAARVIGGLPPDPKHPKWIAGRAIVVFMGDLIDKGQHGLDAIAFVQALRSAANAQGGQVFCLMGNHEAEFLANPGSKKTEEFASELGARGLALYDVAACRGDVGAFLCAEPFALRIRDWFFSHGGNTQGRTIAQLTSLLESGVDNQGFRSPALIGGNSLLEARLGEKGPDGAPWFESDPRLGDRELLKSYARALGVKHLVQGHQPGAVAFADGERRKKGEMFQRYGLLFLVDTGMSEAINDSAGAVLLITAPPAEQAIAICPDGGRTTIWDSKPDTPIGAAKACGR